MFIFVCKVEAVDRDGNIFPVSLWMKRINSDGDPRCVAVIEPVQRAVGSFLFNAEVSHFKRNQLLSIQEFVRIFAYHIPHYALPQNFLSQEHSRFQCTTNNFETSSKLWRIQVFP